jgi:hypothetical protein
MKKLLLAVLMTVAAASVLAQTAPAPAAFTLAVTLTPACQLSVVTPQATLAYTSFAAAASTATPATVNVRCTTGVPFNASVDGATPAAANAYDFSGTNLNYRLTVSASGLQTDGSNTGTGSNVLYSITPSVTTIQAGTCVAGDCTTDESHTLNITF